MTIQDQLHQQLRQALAQSLVQKIHIACDLHHTQYRIQFHSDTSYTTIRKLMFLLHSRYHANPIFHHSSQTLIITVDA